MNNSADFLNEFFGAYKQTSEFKDRSMLDVICRKQEYEKTLDEMWDIARRGNLQQLAIYKQQVKNLKDIGITTLRNSAGKHMIRCAK